LAQKNVKAETLHGGMEQRDRTRVINDFKHNYFRFLIATDVAARGIDVADIAAVYNDLPDNPESYTHRIGRTARFEKRDRLFLWLVLPKEVILLKLNLRSWRLMLKSLR
jgi:superfamily II DNA/RNA helicase